MNEWFKDMNAPVAPASNILQSFPWFRLRPISKALVVAELLDLLTTAAGLAIYPQISEANPMLSALGGWIPLLVIKFLATLFVVYVFERYSRWSMLVWVVPSIAVLPVIWNLFCIFSEALVYSLP